MEKLESHFKAGVIFKYWTPVSIFLLRTGRWIDAKEKLVVLLMFLKKGHL
ncbi:hypothetical protein HanXRQr2_Chr03g0123801 [Helianthus annuus]|uniref:Uncharacterized protein n=1 Tax=Helianthus annuus TaxID=4232 RepID=A0A9K3JH33_HELAN|nr:hypothetical protein HanXRQr2_Chr03g0123801 [Helianthus annuus]